MPALCLALAAGSHTVILKRGLDSDAALKMAGAAVLGCLVLVLGLGLLVLIGEIVLIFAGILPIGSNRPGSVLMVGMLLMVCVGGDMLIRVLDKSGLYNHPSGLQLVIVFVVASVGVPVWRFATLMRREGRSLNPRSWDDPTND